MTTQITEIPKEKARDHTREKACADAYSDERLRDKLSRHALTAGRDVVEKALLLYYALQQEQTPAWAKATIIGSLGYFITPVDAILDLTPGIGYVDDLGVLAFAIATVSTSIDDAVRQRASARLQAWFGDKSTSQVAEAPA